ncbi:hypothetical protein AB0K60_08435 [Thermopolyspora sp. NPDC052614]|uniref:hypothetical protein n=1 Tax=Thermopolyspora sp. NPDC052614 TaxID=3155682 RepID=UPI0034467CBB
MRVRKRLASLALLAGLAGGSLLVGTPAAQAAGGYSCSNGLANLVTCNKTILGIPVSIGIVGNRVLSGNEISILENSLNGLDLNVANIKDSVLGVYGSFNPPINLLLKDVNVCIGSLCI